MSTSRSHPRRPGAAEPQGENLHRRATAPDNSLRDRQHDESDTPGAAPHSPRVVSHITQTKLRPLTTERRQQVADLYRAGVPVKEIVRQTGVNRSTAYRLCGVAVSYRAV
ncbi:hypothetical protein D5R93_05940 [Actinomyces lilanjuaniae]|uniref:Resolvase HTH domain-containing protein n=1 Tax=Actinomyces lilanjuaniae TaxID=2321394 RepID=A0ABM6Z370_9ACTO|nr:helix-turn-helix domain-containing protein [Actinomyces lilanjuaniae]AYD89706.1 hypothetical protein D5R93_05940 [Actinomyces lilanjuaniae]